MESIGTIPRNIPSSFKKRIIKQAHILLPNVRCHLPPLAFGTKACSAGDVPKVPKAWWLGAQPCSHYF
ncbi:MAG: hypothetical protein WC003_17530, partial [Terrimicrobiaceae bacterium]